MSSKHTPDQRKLRDVGVRRFRQECRTALGERVHPVMQIGSIPRTKVVTGAVMLARIAYAEVADYKIRPVVVIASDGRTVTVRPCTSSIRGLQRRDAVMLLDLDEAGLHRSTAVLAHSVCLPLEDLVAVQGKLCGRDLARISHPATGTTRTALGVAA